MRAVWRPLGADASAEPRGATDSLCSPLTVGRYPDSEKKLHVPPEPIA